jgi:hypothetical protein
VFLYEITSSGCTIRQQENIPNSNSLLVTPFGFFVSCSDGQIHEYIWKSNNKGFIKKEEFTLVYPQEAATDFGGAMFLKSVDTRIAASSVLHKVKLWDTETGKLQQKYINNAHFR